MTIAFLNSRKGFGLSFRTICSSRQTPIFLNSSDHFPAGPTAALVGSMLLATLPPARLASAKASPASDADASYLRLVSSSQRPPASKSTKPVPGKVYEIKSDVTISLLTKMRDSHADHATFVHYAERLMRFVGSSYFSCASFYLLTRTRRSTRTGRAHPPTCPALPHPMPRHAMPSLPFPYPFSLPVISYPDS